MHDQDTNEEALHTLKRVFDQLIHEVRAPITIVLGLAQLMQKESIGFLNDNQKDILNQIVHTNAHVYHVFQQYITLYGVLYRPPTEDMTSFLVKDLVYQAIARAKGTHLGTTISLEVNNPSTNQEICTYYDNALIVLFQIIDNAIRYSIPNGRVFISVRHTNAQILVEIRDTGTGMTQEQQENLSKSDQGFVYDPGHFGNGFGISIARILAHRSSIKIEVIKSNKEGSVIHIIFQSV